MTDYKKFITENTIDLDYTRRGGSLKVNASKLFPYVDNAVVGAYQNYLGGGLLGAVVGAAQFLPSELRPGDKKKFDQLLEACKRYFHTITNEAAGDYDHWSESSFERNQSRPVSGY